MAMPRRAPGRPVQPGPDRLQMMEETARELRHLANAPACPISAKLLSVALEFERCIAQIELASGMATRH